jgi:predicted amidohydrolase YtcJ
MQQTLSIFGGDVVTMYDAQPTAEAVAVRDGRILAVGARSDVMQCQGGSTRVVNLRGRTLLPGFIDGHGHVSMVGFHAVSANLLPPPDGPNASVAELQKTLHVFMNTSPIPEKFGVVFGFGYDDSQLKEQRHPTRDDLDAVSKALPVLIVYGRHLGADAKPCRRRDPSSRRHAGAERRPRGDRLLRRPDKGLPEAY